MAAQAIIEGMKVVNADSNNIAVTFPEVSGFDDEKEVLTLF